MQLHEVMRGRIRSGSVSWAAVLLLLTAAPNVSFAGLVWSARAIDPSQIDALKHDQKLLESTLFGEQPPGLAEQLKKDGYVSFSDPKVKASIDAWLAKQKPDDTSVDVDKAWHGIHFLLTGHADPDHTLASKVIMGGEEIGRDLGNGPAELLRPDEVKAVAQLLEATTPELLKQRYKPKEMDREKIYPEGIWERDGEVGWEYVLQNYKRLVTFYKLAAERGQAVIMAIS